MTPGLCSRFRFTHAGTRAQSEPIAQDCPMKMYVVFASSQMLGEEPDQLSIDSRQFDLKLGKEKARLNSEYFSASEC